MKIGFCGTVSVGKTTLVNTLKNHEDFSTYNFFTERSKFLKSIGVPLNEESTLEGQTIFLSERVKELMNSNMVSDRTVIDVMAFTNTAFLINNQQKEQFERYASNFIPQYDYMFYISTVGTILEDNGIRIVDENYRELIDTEIKGLIKKYNDKIKKLVVLEGTVEQRIELILSTLKF